MINRLADDLSIRESTSTGCVCKENAYWNETSNSCACEDGFEYNANNKGCYSSGMPAAAAIGVLSGVLSISISVIVGKLIYDKKQKKKNTEEDFDNEKKI